MLKKLYLVGLGLVFGLFFTLSPASLRPAFAANPGVASPAQQMQQPQQQPQSPTPQQQETQQQQQMEQMQEQQNQQMPHSNAKKQSRLKGKIAMQDGHYVFQESSNNTTLRVSNPSKVKKYNGENVKVKGTVNQTAQTIHVSKVKALSS